MLIPCFSARLPSPLSPEGGTLEFADETPPGIIPEQASPRTPSPAELEELNPALTLGVRHECSTPTVREGL
jgi:hypothetical protein